MVACTLLFGDALQSPHHSPGGKSMTMLKRFVASTALSLALVAAAAPALHAAWLHCTGCVYMGSGVDEYGAYDEYWCNECHIDP
jgi:hypothetical protein